MSNAHGQKYLRMEGKVKIYKTMIRLYSSTLQKQELILKRMKTTEMKTIRNTSNITLQDKQRSSRIRKTCGVIGWMKTDWPEFQKLEDPLGKDHKDKHLRFESKTRSHHL